MKLTESEQRTLDCDILILHLMRCGVCRQAKTAQDCCTVGVSWLCKAAQSNERTENELLVEVQSEIARFEREQAQK